MEENQELGQNLQPWLLKREWGQNMKIDKGFKIAILKMGKGVKNKILREKKRILV